MREGGGSGRERVTIRMKQPASGPDALGQVPTLVPHKQRGMSHSYREGLGAQRERERERVCVCVCACVCACMCPRAGVHTCACLRVPVRVPIPEEDVSWTNSPKLPFMVGYVSLYPVH